MKRKAYVIIFFSLLILSTLNSAVSNNVTNGNVASSSNSMDEQGDSLNRYRGSVLSLVDQLMDSRTEGNEITFREDRIMLLNGEPLFPIGVYFFEREVCNSINDYYRLPWNLQSYEGDAMFVLGENYLFRFLWQRYNDLGYFDEELYENAIRDRDHPNFLGWSSRDEPVWDFGHEEDSAPDLEYLQMLYDKLKEDDPEHFVWMNFAAADVSDSLDIWIQKRRAWSAAADVVSVDVYPKGSSWGPGDDQCVCCHGCPGCYCVIDNTELSVIGDYVDVLLEDVVEFEKPVWMVPQAWGAVNEYMIRFQSWQAIIHGATGIFYWSREDGEHDLIMPDTQHVAQELIDLHSVLVAETVDASVTSTPGIETMVKLVDDEYYILAVYRESTPESVTAEFDLASIGITYDGTGDVINEDLVVDITAGRFTLDFDAFATHIIRVDVGSGSQEVSPYESFVTLTAEELSGMNTCPAGDGDAYKHIKVTIKDYTGIPVEGIAADRFDITVSILLQGNIQYYDTLSCTFSPISQFTDSNGEILFKVTGDTSIIGGISIKVAVMDVLLNDIDILQCKSFDLNTDGSTDLVDITLWVEDHSTGNLRSDFDWNGAVNVVDLGLFLAHYDHHH